MTWTGNSNLLPLPLSSITHHTAVWFGY